MKQEGIWEKPVSHGEILKRIWKNLDLGVIDRNHPFHLPVIGTINESAPDLRIVVLRRFWRKSPCLAFHSHAGSPKIEQIKNNSKIYWLFFHPEERFQVRISAAAEIHTNDELVNEQWLATELLSRRCYIGAAPSQVSEKPTTGLPEDLIDRNPNRDESEIGRANFIVVTSKIEEIDCLEMNVRGHRRSLFTWKDSGELEMKWLTP